MKREAKGQGEIKRYTHFNAEFQRIARRDKKASLSDQCKEIEKDEKQAGIKIAGRNINNLRCADDTTLMAESEGERKSLLMKIKDESEKTDLKLNIQKIKIMASSPITSWQIDGKQWKQLQTLFSWAPKSLQMVATAMKLQDVCSFEEKL